MSDTTIDPAQLVKECEQKINNAKAEVKAHTKVLEELKPQRTEIENDCKAEFELPITKLEGVLVKKEKELEELTVTLATDLGILEADGEE